MEPHPRSRLIPPDPAAVRAAQTAARPKNRGLGLLALAAFAGIGLTAFGRGESGDGTAGSNPSGAPTHRGRVELRAAAPLRRAPGREAEADLLVEWSSATVDVLAGERTDAARSALASWIAARRPTELVEPVGGELTTALERALFPDLDGEVVAAVLRGIRLR